MSRQVEQIITDRIIEKLKQGTVPWQKPWKSASPSNGISKKPYSGINSMMTGMAAYDSAYWLTYKQAQGLGGQVRKGEKGTPIIFWKIDEKEVRNEETGEKEKKKSFILRYYTIFNAEQCDGLGDRFKKEETTESHTPEWESECQAIIDGYAGKPEITSGGSRAYYSPSDDIVNLPARKDFAGPLGYWHTMFHELTHSTGAKHRLDRKISMTRHDYSFEELIAELGACFITGTIGIQTEEQLDQSAAYIQSWIQVLGANPDWIVKAGSRATKAFKLIAGKATESEAVA